jgi:hypothetical protein
MRHHSTTAPALVTSLSFRPGPGANALAFGTNDGQLLRWEGVVPADHAHPSDGPRRKETAGAGARSRSNSLEAALGVVNEALGATGADDMDDWLSDDDDGRYRRALDAELELPPAQKWVGTARAQGGTSSGRALLH